MSKLMSRMMVTSRKTTSRMVTRQLFSQYSLLHGSAPPSISVTLEVQLSVLLQSNPTLIKIIAFIIYYIYNEYLQILCMLACAVSHIPCMAKTELIYTDLF